MQHPTYIVVNTLGRRRSGGNHVVVVPVVNQQDTAGPQALFKVADRLLLLPLVPVVVLHVRERVAQTDDRVEAVGEHVSLDVVVQRQPVGLFNHCGCRGSMWGTLSGQLIRKCGKGERTGTLKVVQKEAVILNCLIWSHSEHYIIISTFPCSISSFRLVLDVHQEQSKASVAVERWTIRLY